MWNTRRQSVSERVRALRQQLLKTEEEAQLEKLQLENERDFLAKNLTWGKREILARENKAIKNKKKSKASYAQHGSCRKTKTISISTWHADPTKLNKRVEPLGTKHSENPILLLN